MATSSALIKTTLHKALAEGVYRDLVTRNSNYYYFLGRTLKWVDETIPEPPIDSFEYERAARNEIITLKEIKASDVSFVIPRYDWTSNNIYDMYDDLYSDEVIGIDIIDGGSGYSSLPTITITGGGGTGALYTPVIDTGSGELIGVDLVSRGSGYVTEPTVTISGGRAVGVGSDAVLKSVVNLSSTGSHTLESSMFYVMTEDYNVYKCLDNNNGARSTVKPSGTQISPILTADGYIWKFMYNVPINLRNKFLSDTQIPVVSALTNQFYSGGALDTILILAKGSGYTTATITPVGDGFLESDPVYLTSILVNEGGSGYADPIVTIGDPVTGASLWIASTGVYQDQKIYTPDGHFYNVVTPGTLGASEPTHVFGTVKNGEVGLQYVGTRARAEATTVGGVVTDITMIGSVRDINVINSGSGYISAPTVNIITAVGDSGSGAVAHVKMNNDSVLYVTVTNPGDNYMINPDITFGDEWTADTAVYINEQYYYSNRLYTVTDSGTLGSTAPTHSTLGQEQTNGTAKLTYVGLPATGSSIRKYGSGYTTAPTIGIVDNPLNPAAGGTGAQAAFLTAKSEAKLLPILENGQLSGITVVDGGIGYSNVTLTVTGDGQDALLSADLGIGNIQSLQANNEILTPAGTINAVKVVSGGYGYGVATIQIEGDGSGATAVATLDNASGRINKITVTNPGTGYTFANIIITGNGHAATARAIMSPYGGHGKNSPDELFAQTLMFYSNVSTDLNQGVAVNNDYRQIGIIKNPRKFGSDLRHTAALGSACYVISADIDTSKFAQDDLLTIPRIINAVTYYRRFRIVSLTADTALIQSLDNDIPATNDVMTLVSDLANPPAISIETVGLPTVDKYSGQMMFIDNKAGFTPSADETVTLRTVLKF
jgi:hypothetical protein